MGPKSASHRKDAKATGRIERCSMGNYFGNEVTETINGALQASNCCITPYYPQFSYYSHSYSRNDVKFEAIKALLQLDLTDKEKIKSIEVIIKN